MIDAPIVDVISRHRATAITIDGERMPIVKWLDDDGDDCQPDDAVVCVAEYGDKYVTIDLRQFYTFGGN